ncbi:MAG: hypothetical protein AB1714_16355 [Acidobacteriota bacterium]
MPEFGVRSLVVDPDRTRTLYALGDGVMRSRDGGLTWESANRGLRNRLSAGTLTMDPLNPQHLLLTSIAGVFTTFNGARRWSLLSTDLLGFTVTELGFDPYNPEIICAFSKEEGGYHRKPLTMHKSTDGGRSWVKTGSGLPETGWVYQVVYDSKVRGRLYAATTDGLYRSDDGGQEWFPMGLDWAECAAIDPIDNHRVYAGTPNGVYVWDSSGRTWTRMSEGLDPGTGELSVSALAFDPFHPRTLYASTAGGIFVRTVTDSRGIPSH